MIIFYLYSRTFSGIHLTVEEDDILKQNTDQWEEIVVENNIKVVHQCVPEIDYQVEECLFVISWKLLLFR